MIAILMVSNSCAAVPESYQVILIAKIFDFMQLHKIKHINLYFFILFLKFIFQNIGKVKS